MEVWQPFAGEAAGLSYRVTFRLADPSGDQLTAAPESRRVDVLLAAGGAAPVKWQELVVREAQDPPAELLADLTAQVHRERRVGIRQRLVLAHEAAQLVREIGHPSLEFWILLTQGLKGERHVENQTENPSHPWRAPGSAGAASSAPPRA